MNRSQQLFRRAQKHIPGGVNSPVRAFRAVGGVPRFIERGKGAYLWDVDGKRYIDFVMSWGPLILGHADPKVTRVVSNQVKKGSSFGAPTANEIKLAELIKSAFPSIEKVRLVSSGTEAVMSAIRLARGATGRKKVIKFDGCYHGHVDSLLVRAGSGAATFGTPDSKGVPEELAKHTISIPFNDPETLEKTIEKNGPQTACLIVEPIPANMGVALPKASFFKRMRALTRKHRIILIFDEVITGFRLAFGGAQEWFSIEADLTCLGKILGGGFPMGAFGGKEEIMNHLAPLGGVYQAGTLSGNPVAVTAGIETLKQLRNRSFYGTLQNKCDYFYSVLQAELKKHSYPVTLNHAGSLFTLFFSPQAVTDFKSAKRSNTDLYGRFFHGLLKSGIYFAPSQFEANFISRAHSVLDLTNAVKIISKTLNRLL